MTTLAKLSISPNQSMKPTALEKRPSMKKLTMIIMGFGITAATFGQSGPPLLMPPPENHWEYLSREDEMGRGTIKEAKVESTNTVEFGIPYSGSQHATLILLKHPVKGHSGVGLKIERGQFMTSFDDSGSGEQWHIAVRFDGGPLQSFLIVRNENGDSRYAIISAYER